MNYKKLMLLPLLCYIHTLVPAALSDDDLSFWDDGWQTGQESTTIPEPLPDLTLHNLSLEEIARRFPEEMIQQSPPDTLPAATAATAPPAKDVSHDRLHANRKPIRMPTGPTTKAVVDDFFMCSKCSYTTGSRKQFENHKQSHLKSHQQSLQPYLCSVPECSYSGQSLERLIDHTQTDHQESIKNYTTP